MAFSVAPPTIQEEVGDTATPKKKRSRGEKKSEDAGAAPGAPMVPTFAGGEAKQPGGRKSLFASGRSPRQRRMGPSTDGRISPMNRSFSVPDLSAGNKEQPFAAAGMNTPVAYQ